MTTNPILLTDAQRSGLTLATAYFDALERRDVPAIGDLFADEVIETIPLSASGDPAPWVVFTGKEQVIDYVQQIMHNFSQVRFTDPTYTVSADGSVVFFEAHGDLVATQGNTNTPYHNVYVFKVTLREGRIVGLREYANPVPIAKLMGLPIG